MAKKRGNGEGGITRHKKSGLYMARYTVQTPTGTKRKTIYGKEREEVAERLIEALSNRNKGLVFEADNLKLDEYLGRWLTDCVRDTVRPTTFERYEQMVRLHIGPVLGKLKLKNLTPSTCAASTARSLMPDSRPAPSNTFTSHFIRRSSRPSLTALSHATPPRPSSRRR